MSKLLDLSEEILQCKVATYSYWDYGPQRVHHWIPSNKWAIGNGPIEYVTEAKAKQYMEKCKAELTK